MTGKNGQNIGYIRVSTLDQNTDRQLQEVELDEVFTEKVSAKDTNRPALQGCLRHVRKGDCLHVHSIDRLARNLQDLLALLEDLTGRGVAVKFHKESLTFTGDENPFQELQLQIIGAVAQFERSLIKERQREGIAAAKRKGKKFGRPRAMDEEQIERAKELLAQGMKPAPIAKQLGVSRSTIYRMVK